MTPFALALLQRVEEFFSEKKHVPIVFKNNNECESLISIFIFNMYKKIL